MRIWVDADACPREVRAILQKAAVRLKVPLVMVANQVIPIPESEWLSTRVVPVRADEADKQIVAELDAGDLVITADVPLAADVVEKGAHALDPRGEMYDAENVRSRLSERNFMEGMRSAGLVQGGPAEYGDVDKQRFAAALDRFLTRRLRGR